MKRLAFLALSAATLMASAALANLTKAGPASVLFKVSGPAGLTIEGKGQALDIADDGAKAKFSVPLASLDTGISLRNRHMREALDGEKFPSVIFEIPRASVAKPAAGASSTGKAKGALSFHGQSKEVEVNYTAKETGGTYAVTTDFAIDMREWGVKPPSYLGVGVKPEVKIQVTFSAKDQ